MKDITQEVQQVISRYHQAIADKDVETALGCLAESYFQIYRTEGEPGAPNRWRTSDLRTPAEWRGRVVKAIDSPVSSYENTLDFQHAHINENAAVVVARETGLSTNAKGEKHSWKGVTNLWCLTRTGGGWKIASSVQGLSD